MELKSSPRRALSGPQRAARLRDATDDEARAEAESLAELRRLAGREATALLGTLWLEDDTDPDTDTDAAPSPGSSA